MAVSYVKRVFASNDIEKTHNVVVIVKRLTYSHHNYARNAFAKIALCGDYLTEYLARRKIAHLTAERRCAEFTAHTATRLRGNAYGITVLIFHHNAFDKLTVVHFEKIFYSTVKRRLLFSYYLRIEEKTDILIRKLFAQRFRNIRHLFDRRAEAKPFQKLICTKWSLAELF